MIVYGSINKMTKTRELIILSLSEFLSKRIDFNFLGNASKDSSVYIFDEGSEVEGLKDSYPRIVLFRNGSRFNNMGGYNDSHEGHEYIDTVYSRTDILTHEFTLRIVASGFGICENLSYAVSNFIRFFSKNIVLEDANRQQLRLEHGGISRVYKTENSLSSTSIFQCDISFMVEDQEIMHFTDNTPGKVFNGINVVVNIPEVKC